MCGSRNWLMRVDFETLDYSLSVIDQWASSAREADPEGGEGTLFIKRAVVKESLKDFMFLALQVSPLLPAVYTQFLGPLQCRFGSNQMLAANSIHYTYYFYL